MNLLQEDVARIVKVSTDTITNWENNRYLPQIHFYPMIIKFLGYCPNGNSTNSIQNQVLQIRQMKGLTHHQLGELFGVDRSTVGSWESGWSEPQKNGAKVIEEMYNTLKIL